MGVSVSEQAAQWGCVVVAQFAAQAMLRLRPELAGRAVAVVEGARPAERVCAVNERAGALGVRAGMTRVEVETFGEVVMLARASGDERAARELLRECLGRFTPRAEERADGVDWVCVLDLSGTERLLGEARVLGGKISRAMRELGFAGRVVVCGNADAGLSLARAGSAVRVVEAGAEAEALAGLPMGVLGLEGDQGDRLAAWGISSLGELAALPEVQLIARMGQAGRTLRMRARGELPHLLEPAEEGISLGETMEFDEPVETLEPLLFCMSGMLERMLARAGEHALALAAVTVSLWLERCADREVGEEIADEAVGVEVVECVPDPVRAERRVAAKLGDSLAERVGRYGRLPEPRLRMKAEEGVRRGWQSQSLRLAGKDPGDTQKTCPSGKVEAGFAVDEARWGLSSASGAVRKAWHRARLMGAADVPPVKGEGERVFGIGDGQAMQQAVGGLALVPRREVAEDAPAVRMEEKVEVEARRVVRDESRWGRAFERTVRPAVPVVDRGLLLKMLHLDLEAHPADGAVVRMRLVGEAGDASRIQLGLFAPPMPEPTRFEDTHARLVATVGEGNVGRVRALDTHAAEGFALERFRLPGVLVKAAESRTAGSAPAMMLRRMRPAAAVRVAMLDRWVARFWFKGARFEVERCFGPWRTSGDWWNGEVWSADTWDVVGRGEDGELLACLVGHDLLRDRWVMEGVYD